MLYGTVLQVFVGAILSMIVGFLWYGPLFGEMWMRIVGATDMDKKAREAMQKAAGPLYAIQFALTILQVGILAHLVRVIQSGYLPMTVPLNALEYALLLWLGFIVPTLAGSAMWNNDTTNIKWARFLIQAGYQLTMAIVYGCLLQFWNI